MKNIPTTCRYPLYFVQYTTSDYTLGLSGLMLWLKQNFPTLDLPNVSSPGTRARSPVVILVGRLAYVVNWFLPLWGNYRNWSAIASSNVLTKSQINKRGHICILLTLRRVRVAIVPVQKQWVLNMMIVCL